MGLHFIIWMTLSLFLDVHPDMADHWVWSRFLTGGYYEHPPMVAFSIKLATLIGGNSILTLKIGAVVFSCLIMLLSYETGKVFFNRRSALIFILIMEGAPFFSVGSIYWSIDQPFMLFWLLGLYAVGKYIKTDNPNWFFLFGLAAGLGALSKYIMILLPAGLFLWCLYESNHRRLLLNWRVYLAALIAIALIIPNLYWNYNHEWITFAFLLGKGLTGNKLSLNPLLFLVTQLFVFSFIFSSFFWYQLIRRKISPSLLFASLPMDRSAGSFLIINGAFPILFFALSSISGKTTDPSWPDIAYFSNFLLLARYIELEWIKENKWKVKLLFLSAYLANLLLTVLTLLQIQYNIFNLTEEDNTLFMLKGWTVTAGDIADMFSKEQIPLPDYVVSIEYQVSSALALYMQNQPLPHSLRKPLRNQWSPVDDVLRKGAVVVCPPQDCESILEEATERFHQPFRLMGRTRVKHAGSYIRPLAVYYMQPLKAETRDKNSTP